MSKTKQNTSTAQQSPRRAKRSVALVNIGADEIVRKKLKYTTNIEHGGLPIEKRDIAVANMTSHEFQGKKFQRQVKLESFQRSSADTTTGKLLN